MVDYQHSDKIITVVDASQPRMIKNILIVDDAVDSSWCDTIIETYERESTPKYDAKVPSLGDDTEVVKLTKVYVGMMDGDVELKEQMNNLLRDAYLMYRMKLPFPILRCGLPEEDFIVELPTIKKYVAGSDDHIGPHSDTYMRGWEETNKVKVWKGDRFLNVLFYLNDVEVGGETQFYFDDCTISVPPRKGRIVVFPPLWTHIHAGMSPISGDKYIANGHLRATLNEGVYKKDYLGY